jgi:putative alpha-1,2-mannosidase
MCSELLTDISRCVCVSAGNSLHWTYFAPHDPHGLISLFKSPESFDAHLTEFMSKSADFITKWGTAAPNPYFWAGNEHDAFAPWLFNFGPNCTKTQYFTRQATHLWFSNTPGGVPGSREDIHICGWSELNCFVCWGVGNEDYGAMATWSAFASLGIFPQAGTMNFLIGSPRVERATLKLKDFRGAYSNLDIVTYDNSEDNVYVSRLLVNGQEYTSAIIDRSVLTAPSGCKLEFYMSSVPASSLCPSSYRAK